MTLGNCLFEAEILVSYLDVDFALSFRLYIQLHHQSESMPSPSSVAHKCLWTTLSLDVALLQKHSTFWPEFLAVPLALAEPFDALPGHPVEAGTKAACPCILVQPSS
jgi:hypothetical protein